MHYKLYIKRKEKRMNQKDVAKKMGMHKQTYYLKENGKTPITIDEGLKLAKLFGCTLDELFGEEVN